MKTEQLFCDKAVNYIYSSTRENAPQLFNMLTSARVSSLLGYINYDSPFGAGLSKTMRTAQELGIDMTECIRQPKYFDSHRKLFERQIQYWYYRPMPEAQDIICSPADSRMFTGSMDDRSLLFIKEKFFDMAELFGEEQERWLRTFYGGSYGLFRLTPEKYHYNHIPVSGRVEDIYEVDGKYHACNPGALIELAEPCSKNKRTVTIINTDVPGGTGCGYVAMIEIVALMIGKITQQYSENMYENPTKLERGMFVRKGQPKSLFQPGSSMVLLVFEEDRIRFSDDIIWNQGRTDVESRYSLNFERPLVETEVDVRSGIGRARSPQNIR